jgi:hypothetical protein
MALFSMVSIGVAAPPPTTHPATDAGDDSLAAGFHLAGNPTSFDDPIQHGAADPSAVWNVKASAIYVYYTQRRAAFTTGKGVEWMFGSAIGVASTVDGHDWKYLGTLKGDHHLSDPVNAQMTWWAPEVKRIGDTYHMWVANPDGIYDDWRGHSYVRHFRSGDGLNWTFCDTPDLKSANVIDPGVCRVGDDWKMWYKNPSPGGFTIFTATSPDLSSWTTTGPAFQPLQPNDQYEAPFVFAWKSRYWMIVDTTQNGCDVFSSPAAGDDWQKSGHLWGAHMGVIAAGNRRYLVNHRGLPKTEQHPGLHGHDSVIDLRELSVDDDGKLVVR